MRGDADHNGYKLPPAQRVNLVVESDLLKLANQSLGPDYVRKIDLYPDSHLLLAPAV